MSGVRIYKPFVEKPADGEDHNVHIYYPHSMVSCSVFFAARLRDFEFFAQFLRKIRKFFRGLVPKMKLF